MLRMSTPKYLNKLVGQGRYIPGTEALYGTGSNRNYFSKILNGLLEEVACCIASIDAYEIRILGQKFILVEIDIERE